MRITLFSLLSFVVLSSGCVATLKPIQPVARTSSGVTVALKEHAGDLFKLEVYNATASPIVVDRDAIMLQRPGKLEARTPGGLMSTYVIAPGRRHAVNLKFSLAHLKHGEPVWIDLHNAVFVDGQKVGVEPIELRVD